MITVSSQETTSVCCQQGSRKNGKLLNGSVETCQRRRYPADIGTRRMSIEGLKESGCLNGPAWLQTDEEKWPKPWCQLNEAEAEKVTSTVARETELDQLVDWRRYSSFNRNRNFIAYCMRFKTKQKGPLKADGVHQAD